MVELIKPDRTQAMKIKDLFGYTNDTLILSFIQNHMGRGWVDDPVNPACAQIIVGDFCYLAGDSELPEALELVKNIPPEFSSPILYVIPQDEAWGKLIEEHYHGRFYKTVRYAIKREKDCFDIEKLRDLAAALPEGYCIVQIDEAICHEAMKHDFSKDWCSQFDSAEDFVKRGLGFCVLHDDQIVCGVSSYGFYDDGIEIQINTKNEYRRKGLATACAAKLILECLNRNLYPSWDAQTKTSVALAEKLGYHFDHEYLTYQINCKSKTE